MTLELLIEAAELVGGGVAFGYSAKKSLTNMGEIFGYNLGYALGKGLSVGIYNGLSGEQRSYDLSSTETKELNRKNLLMVLNGMPYHGLAFVSSVVALHGLGSLAYDVMRSLQ